MVQVRKKRQNVVKAKSSSLKRVLGRVVGLPWLERFTTFRVLSAQAISWHTHPAHEWLFCLKGLLSYEFKDGRVVSIGTGTSLLIPAGVEHRIVGGIDTPSKRCSMFLSVEVDRFERLNGLSRNGPQPELKYGWLKPNGSKNLLTQWRTTPYMIDWNGDGLVDLVMIDTTGTLAFYERAKKDGRRVLLPPKHAFVDENGKAMGFGGWTGEGDGKGGNTGRRKFCFVDWDGDGRLDIVANSGSVCLYRQLKARDGKWFFKKEGDLVEERMAGHSTCPTVCDFDGDGVPDLVIGAEDGYFYFLANPRGK